MLKEGHIATGYQASDAFGEIGQRVADKGGKTPLIVFWSLEMPPTPITMRLLSQALDGGGGSITSSRLVSKEISLDTLHDAVDCLKPIEQHIYFEFDAHTTNEFRLVLNDLTMTHDIVMVIVDYFRLIEEIAIDGSISGQQAGKSEHLRAIAKDYDCHVLSIFDINREGEKSRKPSSSFMKGGTAAKFDGDLVIYAFIDELSCDKDGRPNTNPVCLVLDVVKGRFVEQKTLKLSLDRATGKVDEWRKHDDG